jgi:hypothetical protein
MNLIDRFNAPTPKKWVNIGNILLALSGTLTTFGYFYEYPTLAIASAICGAVGKVLTSLVIDETSLK